MTKRTRERAADYCQLLASNITAYRDNIPAVSDTTWRLADAAYRGVYRHVKRVTGDVLAWAEAEAMLRTGWEP